MDCMDILIKKLRGDADREEKINEGEADEMVISISIVCMQMRPQPCAAGSLSPKINSSHFWFPGDNI